MDASDWEIIRSTPLFGAMTPQMAKTLVGHPTPRCYEKGTTLVIQGEPASAFFIILEGWVKIYRTTPDGLEVVVHVFRGGETFAEAAIFLGGHYPASAETVSPARLLRIDGAAFRSRIEEQPSLAMSMLASASYQLKFLVEQIEQMRVNSAPQRIADFMIGLTDRRAGPATIELPFEKGLLANRLGMKAESLSRALAQLRQYGVTVDREIVKIDDVERLAKFVERSHCSET